MNILGISAIDKESTATLVREGVIVAAVSEERLTRVKQQGGFPTRATEAVLSLAGLRPDQIDIVAYPFFTAWDELSMTAAAALQDMGAAGQKIRARGFSAVLRHYGGLGKSVVDGFRRRLFDYDRQLASGLRACGIAGRLRRYDHQYCHAVTAYYTSGFDRALIVVLDWYGSGKAGGIYLGEGGRLTLCHEILFPNSMGILYASVTGALGFVPDRHEGKVVGLAAYGDPSIVAPAVMERFATSSNGYHFLDALDSSFASRIAATHSREDVAAGYQQALESVVIQMVRRYLQRLGTDKVAGAGGVFANVKMNQKIVELPEVCAFFVHPAMSDMGTGTGAALAAAVEAGECSKPVPLSSVFLGPVYSEKEIVRTLKAAGLSYHAPHCIAEEVARLLAQGKLVARFSGRMEYGPRALGNRSVLALPDHVELTATLNSKLKRNEFMPFAPATLQSAVERCYRFSHKVTHAAQFMTLCLNCSSWMREQSPAAVHVDGTARPQFVTAESNPDLHKILVHTERLTGSPSVINTSFNIHEEPIVCSPDDAIRVFIQGDLDHLAIGKFLVSREIV